VTGGDVFTSPYFLQEILTKVYSKMQEASIRYLLRVMMYAVTEIRFHSFKQL
jgi:hypothetical protein